MSLFAGSLFTESVTIWRPGGPTGDTDDYGIPITSTPTEQIVKGWYEPRGSSEDLAAKEQRNDGYWVYLPRTVDLSAEDRVLIEGSWYEVDGEPGRMPDGFIMSGYLSVAVRRVTG